MNDIENKLRDAVINGQPRSHRPWKKILIIVEGVYRFELTLLYFVYSINYELC